MVKEKQTFEDFMEDCYNKAADGVLDDDLPDGFNGWLGDLDGEEYMEYAQLYGQKRYLEGKEEVVEAFRPHINNLRNITGLII